MRTQKPQVKLEDWAVVPAQQAGEYQELRAGSLLVGRAFGHPKVKEGVFIFSSPITSFDTDTGIAETKNTLYLLGRVSREYKTWTGEQSAA
jgi:hypothetical protein